MSYHLRKNWKVPLSRLFNREAFLRFLALNSDIFIRSLVLLTHLCCLHITQRPAE